VYAIWQSLCVFGLQGQDFNIITNNDYVHKQQYKCLTKNKLYSFDDFKDKLVSFEHLVVGMGRNGYALGHNDPVTNRRSLSVRASYLPPF